MTIVAVNIAGNSVAATAQCIACVNPNTPVNLREDTRLRTLNALGIVWDDGFSNGAIGQTYTISYSWNDNINNINNLNNINNNFVQNEQVVGLTERAFLAQNLFVGTEYSISVSATNICGTSEPAAIRLTAGIAPTLPCNVFTRNIENDRVQCSWSSGQDNGFPIYGYRVLIQGANNNYQNVVSLCEENQQ
jgi:hypothetical protein